MPSALAISVAPRRREALGFHFAHVCGIYRSRPALVDACGLCLGDAFELTLATQIGFELREHAEHVQEALAGSGAGIDRLRGRSQRGAAGLHLSIQVVRARKLAAIQRQVAVGAVGSAWRAALDQVWTFLRSQPGLRTEDGHNVFLYQHSPHRNAPMNVDFGVEVARRFETSGEVYEVATAVRIGGYNRLSETHGAIRAWTQAHQRALAGQSWEIYSDWSDAPSRLETTVAYLLN
jgi:hypothetical protein